MPSAQAIEQVHMKKKKTETLMQSQIMLVIKAQISNIQSGNQKPFAGAAGLLIERSTALCRSYEMF